MPLNDNAVFSVGSGNYFHAATGTPLPSDLTVAPSTPWKQFGHTSLEDILSITSEGGEATVLGTLQNKSLRTKYSSRQDSLAIVLQQFDAEGLKLYYGANAPTLADGTIGVPVDPQPTIAAFLAIYMDGDNVFGIYAPKAEIFRGGDLEISDTESLAGLPLSVKPMPYEDNNWAYAITPLGAVSGG